MNLADAIPVAMPAIDPASTIAKTSAETRRDVSGRRADRHPDPDLPPPLDH